MQNMKDEELSFRIAKVLQRIQRIAPGLARKIEFANGALHTSLSDVRRGLVVIRGINTTEFSDQALSYLRKPNLFIQIFEVLRNVIVLMPILVTWYGLYEAISTYSQFLALNSGSTSYPFIVLWETGFGGLLDSKFIFSRIAFYDASLIFVVIIITAVINLKTVFLDEAYLKRVHILKNEVDDILWELDGQLNERYSTLTSGANEQLDPIIAQLEKLATKVEEQTNNVLNYIAAEHDRIVNLNEVQRLNAASLENSATTFFKASSQIVDVFSDLRNKISELSSNELRYSEETTRMLGSSDLIVKYLRQIEESVSITKQDISKLATTQIGILDELGDTSGRLANSVQNLVINIEDLQNVVEEIPAKIGPLHIELTNDHSLERKSIEELPNKASVAKAPSFWTHLFGQKNKIPRKAKKQQKGDLKKNRVSK